MSQAIPAESSAPPTVVGIGSPVRKPLRDALSVTVPGRRGVVLRTTYCAPAGIETTVSSAMIVLSAETT